MHINDIINYKKEDLFYNKSTDIPIKNIFIDKKLRNSVNSLIKELYIGKNFVLVCDSNSYQAFGCTLEKELKKQFKIKTLCLNGNVSATNSIALDLSKKIKNFDAVIAVGSGTINDLCKYSSFLENKPYVIFGTALSMNGYSSANATISINGRKKSFPCHLPKAILLDVDVLINSPNRLTKSGIGDLLCTSTSHFDWLLSHLLIDTEYEILPFLWLKHIEKEIFDHADLLIKGDEFLIKEMAKAIIISGLGMYICNGSYPASQSEHMISHAMESICKKKCKTLHGEQIGVTTLSVANIQEKILANGIKIKDLEESFFYKKRIFDFFGKDLGEEYLKEYELKCNKITLSNIDNKTSSEMSKIRDSLSKILIPRSKLLKILNKISAINDPNDLGWPKEIYMEVIKHSKYTRNRFTCLDIF